MVHFYTFSSRSIMTGWKKWWVPWAGGLDLVCIGSFLRLSETHALTGKASADMLRLQAKPGSNMKKEPPGKQPSLTHFILSQTQKGQGELLTKTCLLIFHLGSSSITKLGSYSRVGSAPCTQRDPSLTHPNKPINCTLWFR